MLGWVVDVYYVHGVLIVVFAVLVGEDALIVGWAQLEDDVAGLAEEQKTQALPSAPSVARMGSILATK